MPKAVPRGPAALGDQPPKVDLVNHRGCEVENNNGHGTMSQWEWPFPLDLTR